MTDVVVIGGGQAGLAAGYFLRRAGLEFVILDDYAGPGGAWQHGWQSLRLFSPAEYSPLPGWPMPAQKGESFPTADHVVDYLTRYEHRYDLPVKRPVHVSNVYQDRGQLFVDTDTGTLETTAVISATGTWQRPYVPHYPGCEDFTGRQLHTVEYYSPEDYTDQRVVIVGGGTSAAQIVSEVSTVAQTLWVTQRRPRFMPDDVDGRVLFDVATAREAAQRAGRDHDGVSGHGDIVMVPPVRAARDRGDLSASPMFERLTSAGVSWADGSEYSCDAIIWCTGFKPHLKHLKGLELTWENGHPVTVGTRSIDVPGLHLLGYGDWTGFSSATIIGAARTAKSAVADVSEYVRSTQAQ